MKVIQEVKGLDSDSVPTPVTYYNGDDKAEAIAALAAAATCTSEWYTIVSVRIEF